MEALTRARRTRWPSTFSSSLHLRRFEQMALWWGRSPRGSSLTPGPTYRSRAPASPFACTPLRSYASIPHTSQSCSFADCCPLGVSPSGGSAGMCSRLVLLCCAETQCEFGMWYECDACARDERAQKRAEEAEESEEGSRGQISRALASVSSMLLCVLNCGISSGVFFSWRTCSRPRFRS